MPDPGMSMGGPTPAERLTPEQKRKAELGEINKRLGEKIGVIAESLLWLDRRPTPYVEQPGVALIKKGRTFRDRYTPGGELKSGEPIEPHQINGIIAEGTRADRVSKEEFLELAGGRYVTDGAIYQRSTEMPSGILSADIPIAENLAGPQIMAMQEKFGKDTVEHRLPNFPIQWKMRMKWSGVSNQLELEVYRTTVESTVKRPQGDQVVGKLEDGGSYYRIPKEQLE